MVRVGLNAAAHLAAGVAMGALAVLAAAYVMEQQRRRGRRAGPGGGRRRCPSPRAGEAVRDEPVQGEMSGDPGAI
jgi:hypothetical protein